MKCSLTRVYFQEVENNSSVREEKMVAGTTVWCLLMGVVCLWEVSVSGGPTVIQFQIANTYNKYKVLTATL